MKMIIRSLPQTPRGRGRGGGAPGPKNVPEAISDYFGLEYFGALTGLTNQWKRMVSGTGCAKTLRQTMVLGDPWGR